ncbi:DUF4176 domain-containing protein [Leifsonia sp. L25]|uniref:DUF4176 domain-containing protein n=1 Tax=Actinomycetes TaxID=1760 RepID=UPI003D69F139
MSEIPELLPLGSAVTIEDDDAIYVIVARGLQKLDDDGFLAGYKGVRHPQGAGAGVREIVIRQTQIAEVVHRGHEDAKDAVFAREQLDNAKTPPAKKPPPDEEPDLTVDLTKPAAVTALAPPPARTEAPASVGSVMNMKDPFSELRSKGRRA